MGLGRAVGHHSGGNGGRGHYGNHLTPGHHRGGGMGGNNGGGRGRGRGSGRGRGGRGNDHGSGGSYLKESMLQDPWEQLVQQHMIPQGLLHPSQSTVNFRPITMAKMSNDSSAMYSSRDNVEEIPIDEEGEEDDDNRSSSKRDGNDDDDVVHASGHED